jgi:hypothetical protein
MPKVRGLRTIKKEILKLIEVYVDKAEDLQAVRAQMVPPLLDSVLVDYNRNVAGARDAEVLKACSTIITKLSVSTPAVICKIIKLTVTRLSWRTKFLLSCRTSLSALWK